MSEEMKEDIVREMRMGSTGDMPCAYIVGMPDTIEEFPCGGKVPKINIKRVTVEELADRFEAAFERELVGNEAAARATLRYILNQIDNNPDRLSAGNLLCVIGDKAQATLAKPARNCDLGTAEERVERFGRFCISHKATLPPPAKCVRCRIRGEYHVHKCIFEWEQMPYEAKEGEGDA